MDSFKVLLAARDYYRTIDNYLASMEIVGQMAATCFSYRVTTFFSRKLGFRVDSYRDSGEVPCSVAWSHSDSNSTWSSESGTQDYFNRELLIATLNTDGLLVKALTNHPGNILSDVWCPRMDNERTIDGRPCAEFSFSVVDATIEMWIELGTPNIRRVIHSQNLGGFVGENNPLIRQSMDAESAKLRVQYNIFPCPTRCLELEDLSFCP